jgi:hypothetical protein
MIIRIQACQTMPLPELNNATFWSEASSYLLAQSRLGLGVGTVVCQPARRASAHSIGRPRPGRVLPPPRVSYRHRRLAVDLRLVVGGGARKPTLRRSKGRRMCEQLELAGGG